MSSKIPHPEEVSIADFVKNRAATSGSGKRNLASSNNKLSTKSRNLVRPVKPIFEGKSIEEALPRRNSDSSVSSHAIQRVLDDDEISVSSVQNLETIPSVSESAGILSIISSNFRKNRSITERRIGELPNRRQLQTDTNAVVLTDIQQSSGVYGTTTTSSAESSDDSNGSNGSNGSPSKRRNFRASLLSPNTGAPKRKDSLGLFRGASLRNLIKQADSNHRRMVALEDSEHEKNFADFSSQEKDDKAAASSPSTPDRNATTIPKETDNYDTLEERATRKTSSRRPKRNSSTSTAAKDSELQRAKERMRGTRRKNGKAAKDGSGSAPQPSPSGGEKSTGATSSSDSFTDLQTRTSSAQDTTSELNDSFAWFPIVQSNDFLSPHASGTKLSLNDTDDSQRGGYSSDSSEYHLKSRARWHMSKEGQQVQERIRQQTQSLAETLASSTILPSDDDVDDKAKPGFKEYETKHIENEWHDASGNAIASKQGNDDRNSTYKPNIAADNHKDLFRGKSLEKALPEETRKIDRNNEMSDPENSMPSLATITTMTEEASITNDAFARQHDSNVVKEASGAEDDDNHRPSTKAPKRDPRASITKEHRRRHLEALDLEQSNHSTPAIPEMRTYEWASIKPTDQHVREFDRDDKVYAARGKKTSATKPKSKPQPLQLARAIARLRKTDHSEASSMGESHRMESIAGMSGDGIMEHVSKRSAFVEAPDNDQQDKRKSSTSGGSDKDLKNVKSKAKKAMAATEKAFDNGAISKDPAGVESVGWQRIVQTTDRVENKTYSRSSSDNRSPMKPAKKQQCSATTEKNSRTTLKDAGSSPDFDWNAIEVKSNHREEQMYRKEEQKAVPGSENSNNVIGSPNEYEKESKAPAMWLPPSEWQDDKINNLDTQDTKKKSKKAVEKTKTKKSKRGNSPEGKKTSKCGAAPSKAKATYGEKSDAQSSPFAERPSEAGPFATRPKGIKIDDGTRDRAEGASADPDLDGESSDLEGTRRERSSSVDEGYSVEMDDDEKSTQSVDRHLVRESSHRRLLRKQVADRRDSLQTILQATKRHTVPDEDDILSIKRKLALSQALVQKLEIEKAEIRRKSVLDIARAQMILLEQRDNREKELEKQLKAMTEERNAAVDECHQLRRFIAGTCEMCKRRFDENEQYFMDHYERNTTLSMQEHPKSSAFEWVSDSLSTEALDLETNATFRSVRGTDNENYSLGGATIPESDTASFKATPLQWLSEKLFKGQDDPVTNNSSASRDNISFDSINVEHNADEEYQEACTAVEQIKAETKAPEPNPKKSFLGSLLGEKVVDEFASLALPPTITNGTDAPKRFSLFGGLKGEEVTEYQLFSGIGQSLASISEEKEHVPEKKKKRFGLQDEQVLDNVELFNSLQLLGNQPGKIDAQTANKKKRFGLKDEQVHEDLLDASIINAVNTRMKVREAQPVEAKSRSFLGQEVVDVDDHDDQLLSLLNQSSPSKSSLSVSRTEKVVPQDESVDEDRREKLLVSSPGHSPRANSFKSKPKANQFAGSNLSSPFTRKRNRGKAHTRHDAAAPKYLGKYGSASPSPSTGSLEMLSIDPDRMDVQPTTPVFSDADGSESSSPQPEKGRASDMGERPWKTKITEKQAMEPEMTAVAQSEQTNEVEEDAAAMDEIDQVASLVEAENNAWD